MSPPGESSAPNLGFSFLGGGGINDSGFFNANKMDYQKTAEHGWFHWGGCQVSS